MGDWLTLEVPDVTVPSRAIRSPGRTSSVALVGTSPAGVSTHVPSGARMWAVSGANATSERMALRARSRLRASMSSATAKSHITTAASGHWPIAIAPTTATDISKFMVRRRARRAWNPLRSVSRPPSAIAAVAIIATSSDRSWAPAMTTTSEPTASSPAHALMASVRFESAVSSTDPSMASTGRGRMPKPRIAASMGAGSVRS